MKTMIFQTALGLLLLTSHLQVSASPTGGAAGSRLSSVRERGSASTTEHAEETSTQEPRESQREPAGSSLAHRLSNLGQRKPATDGDEDSSSSSPAREGPPTPAGGKPASSSPAEEEHVHTAGESHDHDQVKPGQNQQQQVETSTHTQVVSSTSTHVESSTPKQDESSSTPAQVESSTRRGPTPQRRPAVAATQGQREGNATPSRRPGTVRGQETPAAEE